MPFFQFQFLCLSFLQVVRRGSGPLSPATHAHSTSHSQAYTTNNIYTPMGALPDGIRTRADLAVVVERVLILPSATLPSGYRQPRGDIHTHPWPGGSFSLGKNAPPSVRFELTSIGTATSENFLQRPWGHRATSYSQYFQYQSCITKNLYSRLILKCMNENTSS
jgi:hypothetical protein